MGWATQYIQQLSEGHTSQFRPRGNSMSGYIKSGQLVTVEPLGGRLLAKGDIVLCVVNGNQYLHLVKALKNNQVQIGNAHGHVNGWTPRSKIYGVVTKIE